MLSPLRRSLRQIALLLGVVLALLHGPAELFHERLHTPPAACLSSDEVGIAAPEHACALCSLATLVGSVPQVAVAQPQPVFLSWGQADTPLKEQPVLARLVRACSLRAPPAVA